MPTGPAEQTEKDREELILDAVLRILAREGIAGISVRAVAREAGVSHGLVGYYYDGKVSLIRSALERIEQQDLDLVSPDEDGEPDDRLRSVLRRVTRPDLLTTEYLSLRLQLWSLARVHEEFEAVNTAAQARYRAGLAELIAAARPGLSREECRQRAADVDVLQNGMWLTALLGLDADSIQRSLDRCEEIALAP